MMWTYRDKYVYDAELLRVVDGDTIDVMIDFGMELYKKERLRLFGINAPELRRGTQEQKEAGRLAKQWLEGVLVGSPLVIKTHKDKKGKFGRYLAEIFVAGKNVNELMVAKGHAVSADY